MIADLGGGHVPAVVRWSASRPVHRSGPSRHARRPSGPSSRVVTVDADTEASCDYWGVDSGGASHVERTRPADAPVGGAGAGGPCTHRVGRSARDRCHDAPCPGATREILPAEPLQEAEFAVQERGSHPPAASSDGGPAAGLAPALRRGRRRARSAGRAVICRAGEAGEPPRRSPPGTPGAADGDLVLRASRAARSVSSRGEPVACRTNHFQRERSLLRVERTPWSEACASGAQPLGRPLRP